MRQVPKDGTIITEMQFKEQTMTNYGLCKIREQIIHDEQLSGLVIQFEVVGDGTARLRIYGDNLENGNRDFAFNIEGDLVGRGTALSGPNRPTVALDVNRL